MAKLVVGCGYLGRRVAKRWQQGGESVWAMTRSAARGEEFTAEGLQPLVADLTQPEGLGNALGGVPEHHGRRSLQAEVDTVLFAVGYDHAAGRSIREVYVDGLRNLLDALPASVSRFVYISSTGVYGQTDGDWVTEESPCRPTREAGRACLAAETLLRSHPLGHRSFVLRLAGIYGPGRIPRSSDLLAGRPILAPSEGYLNLIHVDDAAAIVLAVEQHAQPGRLYLVSDGAPVARREYYAELARLLGAPEPRFENPPADSPAAQRAGSDKRICNARLRSEIPLALAYPSYREGLAAVLGLSS